MKYDVAIVGAGIIGLSHAYAAVKRGLSVLICERTDTPWGASIKNFGLGSVTGQKEGSMLALTKKSRDIWKEWFGHTEIDEKSNGLLVIARNQLERVVLESFSATKAKEYGYACELLSQKQMKALYGGRFARYPAILHGQEDQVVFSRDVMPKIISYLSNLSNIVMKFSTLVLKIDHDNGRLHTTQGEFHAEHIIICSGQDYELLTSDMSDSKQTLPCRMLMLKVKPKTPFKLQHAINTGLSCMHYEAFRDVPELQMLQTAIEMDYPEHVKHGVHLLITPTRDGDFIIGDSHEYAQKERPFDNGGIESLLLELSQETLDLELEVKERWIGQQSIQDRKPYSVIQAHKNVTAVSMKTGLGMSIGPALGEQNIARLVNA